MKILIPILLLLVIVSVNTSIGDEVSGTYSGNGLAFTFLDTANVDIESTVKQIVEQGPSGVKYGPETVSTVRGLYVTYSAQEFSELNESMNAKHGDSAGILKVLKSYSPEKGYKRWIIISVQDRVKYVLADSDRSIVDVLTNSVYKKPWYSR